MKKLGNIHQMIVDQLEAGMVEDNCEFVFSVKANAIGDLFVAMLRKVLNRTRYTIRIRGSQADRKGKREAGFTNVTDQNVPLKHADRYRIYIGGIQTVEITANKERAFQQHIMGLERSNDSLTKTLAAADTDYADLKSRADQFAGLYDTAHKEMQKFARRFEAAAIDLHEANKINLDLKGQVRRLTEAGVMYQNNILALKKEIADMKAAAYSRLFNAAVPETFAVIFSNKAMQEVAQLAAFQRGYRWLDDDFSGGTQRNYVKRTDFKAIFFEYKKGAYAMSYVTDTSDLTAASVIFDADQEGGFTAYLDHLERMSYCQMTADEHRLFMDGQKLQAVKAIKDRTGLGLYEAKRIIDSVPSFKK